jgi:hypothetical protein
LFARFFKEGFHMDRIGSRSMQVSKAVEMYLSGVSVMKAAMACGISKTSLYAYLKFTNTRRPPLRRGLPSRTDPTPQEIEERAAAIRESWSPSERATRYVGANYRNERLQRMYASLRRRLATEAA